MVFSSVPVYLDPPNWQQQAANNHQGTSNTNTTENLQLPPPLPPPAAPGSSGSIRPSSMPDRARLAKLPQPEAALKCPRCESINTKFCYFNNYSLSQPRHFCKTCRRYWTRGGALRNVPVGGGCRRNKRSKSTGSSKSPVTAEHHAAAGSSSTSSSIPSSSGCASDIISHIVHHQPPQQLPFMGNLHHLAHDYGVPDHHHHHHHMGLNFGGIQQSAGGRPELDFQMGRNSSTGDGGSNVLSSGGAEQWRIHQVQQFPFLAGLEPPPGGLYPFEGEGVDPPGYVGQVRAGASGSVPMHGSLGPVKMEENQGLNLPRSFFGINVPGNDQYSLGGINAWTDLSGFSSSSASHLL